ncbi:CGNR zinc finger domain-containing protein [Streptosporangium lutulentum]|uniref:RNA-binding Zn ribbon-like protein n=1 Tax=Streptosporangium lutulentum TaxID=1461250 RepID=A0ABT9QKX7_9ACTN|nr:ABATE domain-containing protein [Streptosporangium lutulentum]MDP9846579.1 putative RNA-binding Zn ribbon-like protein [Streptosporangium lutulentum]
MDFTFISGNPGLDLAGTVGHRRHERWELLESPEDLARWTVSAGLLDAPPAVDPAELVAARTLREAIYRLARASCDGTEYGRADRELLNQAAAGMPVGVRLGDGARVERAGDLATAMTTVARDAVELLGGPSARDIRECDEERCTRLYVDGSRRGSRRWCDMRECGNRAKAAAFRARHRL